MFTQCDEYRWMFGDLNRLMEDNIRYYKIDGAVAYPSVTSVISFISRKKFADWRARVGNEEANRKTKHATTRGTKFHRVVEVYLQNGDYKALEEYKKFLSIQYDVQLRQSLSKLNEKDLIDIYQQETGHVFMTGSVLLEQLTLICEVDGELSHCGLQNFCQKEKPEEWLEDYFVQLSAYWAMFSERDWSCS